MSARSKSIAVLVGLVIAVGGAVAVIHPTVHHGKTLYGRNGKTKVP